MNLLEYLVTSFEKKLAKMRWEGKFDLLSYAFNFYPLRHASTNVSFKEFIKLIQKEDRETGSANIEWESGLQSARIIPSCKIFGCKFQKLS